MASLRRGRMCIYGFAFSTRRATPSAFVTAIELRYVPEGNYRSKPPAPDVLGHMTKTLRKLMCERVVTLLVALSGRKAIRETGWFAEVGLTV